MAQDIPDGFTFCERVPAFGRYPELTFRFRPALPERVQSYLSQSSGKTWMKAVSELLVDHLVEWDLPNKALIGYKGESPDETAPIEAKTMKMVPHPIITAIAAQITGYAASGEADADAGE